jgi:hypothetical protein
MPFLFLRIQRMADDFSFNPANDAFGDMGGMMRRPLREP